MSFKWSLSVVSALVLLSCFGGGSKPASTDSVGGDGGSEVVTDSRQEMAYDGGTYDLLEESAALDASDGGDLSASDGVIGDIVPSEVTTVSTDQPQVP